MIVSKRAEHPEDRKRVYALRAAEYARCYGNIPADEFRDELDDALLPDGTGQSYTLLFEEDGKPVGTSRLTFARLPGHPSLACDCRELMDFDLDGLVRTAGFDPERAVAAEVGKLAVARDCDVTLAKRHVFSGMADEAALLGIDVVLSIMSPMVARRTRQGGVYWVRWQEARLRRSSLEHLRSLLKYHDYFLPGLRRQGLEIDPRPLEFVENLPALQALTSDCDDGAFLWYVRTEDWVRTVLR